MNTENIEIPHIDQNTIECDLRAFTRWLNALADQVNWLTKRHLALETKVEENTEEIRKLKVRVTNIEDQITLLDGRITNLEEIVSHIDIDAIEQLIDMVNGRVDLLYSWLPVPYGMIPGLGWKFAMGNINVMSSTDAPTSTSGPGIYTSGIVEDNDINFK